MLSECLRNKLISLQSILVLLPPPPQCVPKDIDAERGDWGGSWRRWKEYVIRGSNLQPTPSSFALSAVSAPGKAAGDSHGTGYCSGYAGTPRISQSPPLHQTHTHKFYHTCEDTQWQNYLSNNIICLGILDHCGKSCTSLSRTAYMLQ